MGQFALVPIPLFLLMGELLLKTGLAARTVEVVDQWIGRIPGRLSLSSVGGGTLFGALSGASMASVAMLGSTLVPEMARRGYKPAMSVSSILAGGGLAVLIPPSALGVLLGAMAKVSIAELLLGGILPGLVLAVMYIAYFAVRATVQPELAPRYAAPPVPLGARLRGLLEVAPLLLLVLVVTGFIFLGIATPSESAAMGVVATLVPAAGYCGSRLRLADAGLGETDRIDGIPFGKGRPRNGLPDLLPIVRPTIRRVEQHVRVKEHHGSRVIRRSCSHERDPLSGDRSIASRHASRLIPSVSSGRCRRTRANRSSP